MESGRHRRRLVARYSLIEAPFPIPVPWEGENLHHSPPPRSLPRVIGVGVMRQPGACGYVRSIDGPLSTSAAPQPGEIFRPSLPARGVVLEESFAFREHERVGAAGAARLMRDRELAAIDDLMDVRAVILGQRPLEDSPVRGDQKRAERPASLTAAAEVG